MRVVALAESEHAVDDLARLGAAAQEDPATFIAYFGEHRRAIADELLEVPDLGARAHLAVADDGTLLGWLVAEVDDDMGRVWWWGPVAAATADWDAVADRLYAIARAALSPDVAEEELAADDGHADIARFAERHGFATDTASVLLERPITASDPDDDDPRVRGFEPDDATTVAALHDEMFPGTHTTGSRLTRSDSSDLRLVSTIDDRITGYVSMQLESDGSGYVDYLGVAEEHRGQGLGAALVAAGIAALRARQAPRAHLTVREDNGIARRLYASVGFVEVRSVRPYRRGFQLG